MSKPIRPTHEINITGFNSIYYLELGKNFYHTPEKHDFWEMAYVDSGKTIAVMNDVSYPLVQGQVVFHRPGELHSHYSNHKDPSDLFIVCFSCSSRAMSFFEQKIFMLEKNSRKILSLFFDEAENALGRLKNRYRDNSALSFNNSKFGAPQLMECYFVEFLFSLIRSEDKSIKSINRTNTIAKVAENALVDEINDYLAENLHKQITLQNLCSHFNLSKSYICRIYKEYTSSSIIKHLSSIKIKAAKQLLRQDDMNISQIADKLGYSSIHNFTRSFKNETGVSPSEYKKRL
ncbi:MAG: AraC family transcriptional regulator [Monoglobales bacterium]